MRSDVTRELPGRNSLSFYRLRQIATAPGTHPSRNRSGYRFTLAELYNLHDLVGTHRMDVRVSIVLRLH